MNIRFVGLCFGLLYVAPAARLHALPPSAGQHWIATWGSSQMRGGDGADNLPKQPLNGATLRQIVHLSLGGPRIMLHFSNAFGERPLVLRSVHVAALKSLSDGTIDDHAQVDVQFDGEAAVTIPAGAEYFSDPIAAAVQPYADLVVTMVIDSAPKTVTTHPGANATSYLVAGDHAAEKRLSSPETLLHWYFLAGVEVQSPLASATVVALGDSITDGHGVKPDTNERWPDFLAGRLAPEGMAIANEGIGGGRILADGLGPSALARFDRDVVATAGVRYAIVLEGVNDLGGLDRAEAHPADVHKALVHALESAYVQMVTRAHARGILVYGGTVMPYTGSDYYHPSAESEADRVALNQWIRTSGVFDAVIDFDSAMRDPAHPERLDAAVDSGDHLHPSPAGYRRMGGLVSLQLFGVKGK